MAIAFQRADWLRKNIGEADWPQLVDLVDLLGHEPNASVRHCLVRHLRSAVLAAYDAGQ